MNRLQLIFSVVLAFVFVVLFIATCGDDDDDDDDEDNDDNDDDDDDYNECDWDGYVACFNDADLELFDCTRDCRDRYGFDDTCQMTLCNSDCSITKWEAVIECIEKFDCEDYVEEGFDIESLLCIIDCEKQVRDCLTADCLDPNCYPAVLECVENCE